MSDAVSVVVAHHERVTMRVGDTFVKVDAEDWRIQREAAALALASAPSDGEVPVPGVRRREPSGGVAADTVPAPAVLWREPKVLALAALPGEPLAELGRPSSAPAAAWRAAGAVARRIHSLPPPPWTAWDHEGFRSFLDGEARWLVDHGVAPTDVVARMQLLTEPALRPFPMVFTHGDFQAAHVLIVGESVTGVVDWADACPGDAWFDLAVLTVGHPEHLDDVLAGYGDDVDRDVVRAWWAVRKLGSVRWMIEHGFDATGDVAELHRFAAE